MFILRVVEILNKHKIPYALVGGHAVSLHGAVRGTIDIDFIVKWTLANLKKVESALSEIGLSSRHPINASDLFHFKDEYIKNKHMVAWNFINHIDPSEQVDIIITFPLEGKKIKKIKVANTEINLLNVEDLIEMKKKSGRPQDLIDIKALKRIYDK